MEVNKIIVGPGCNMSHQELSNFNFEGLDLRGANFHGANLTNAKFDNAILHGCNFLETNLNGASFRNCEFYAAESVYTNEDFEAVERQNRTRKQSEQLFVIFQTETHFLRRL
jgi:uncharacterized protein YjbI with pentapeptide repeats